jgi:hypothetical protein
MLFFAKGVATPRRTCACIAYGPEGLCQTFVGLLYDFFSPQSIAVGGVLRGRVGFGLGGAFACWPGRTWSYPV